MADVITTTRYDDFDGSSTEDVERYFFTWDNQDWEIDLSPKSAKKLIDTMSQYTAKARPAEVETKPERAPRTVRGATAKRASTASGYNKDQLQAAREWLRSQGYEVSPRGRIKADWLAIYEESHAA